jgi:hypothetical protein
VSTDVERYTAELVDREFARMMAEARLFAKMPGLKKEIAGNPDAVAGIALSLRAYGMAVTLPAINSAFDWIEGRAEPSALFYQALAFHNGYKIRPVERTAERAVALIVAPDGEETTIEFTTEDAINAHRLDEWVEDYVDTGEKYRDSGRPVKKKVVVAISVDGNPVADLPEWAEAKRTVQAEVKRYDAWWNYRTDMMWKSAAKRAVKVAAPHLLLGSDSDHAAFAAPDRDRPPVGKPSMSGEVGPRVIDVETGELRRPPASAVGSYDPGPEPPAPVAQPQPSMGGTRPAARTRKVPNEPPEGYDPDGEPF